MADTKISALTQLAEAPAATDEFVVVDKDDLTMAASGTDKRITAADLFENVPWVNVKRDYGAVANGSTDAAAAFQGAINDVAADGGGIVHVPASASAYALSNIVMKAGVWLRGDGYRSQLKSIDSNANAYVITLSAGTDQDVWLSDFSMNGNKANQTANGGIMFDQGTNLLGRHRFDRLYLFQFKNDGIRLKSKLSGSFFTNLYLGGNDGNGFVAESGATDNVISNAYVGNSGLAGIIIAGAANRLVGCKSFFSGLVTAASGRGFELTGGMAYMASCESQDNASHAFHFDGAGHNAVGLVADSCDGNAFNLNNVTKSRINGMASDISAGTAWTYDNILNLAGTCSTLDIDITYESGSVSGSAVNGSATSSAIDVRLQGATTSAYTPSNVTTDRSFNANSYSSDELADVLGTLIADLQGRGILG